MVIHELETKRGLQQETTMRTVFNATSAAIESHPEEYPALRTIIGRAGLHISSRRARVVLAQAGIFVRVRLDRDGWNRYNISSHSEATAVSHLQHLFLKDPPKTKTYTLEHLNRGLVEYHPEIYTTLGKALNKAGITISPQRIGEVAQKLSQLGFKVGAYSEQTRGDSRRNTTVKRYCVLTEELPELVGYLRKAKWVLNGATSISR